MEIDTNNSASAGDGIDKLTPTVVNGVMGLECYGSDDDVRDESPKKRIRHDAEPNDDDEGHLDGELEFMQALKEFETSDPEALQAIIAEEEKNGLILN